MSIEYNKMFTEEGEQETCDNCGYPAPLFEFKNGPVIPGDEKHKFCEICSTTFLGRATSHPRLYGEHLYLFSALGYLFNQHLEEARKGFNQTVSLLIVVGALNIVIATLTFWGLNQILLILKELVQR